MQVTGPYAISSVYVKGISVYTNKVPLGPYRGAGRPEAAFLYERMMDLVADELHLDPVEVRLRNTSTKPTISPLGIKLDPFEPFLRKAIDELGYNGRKGKVGFSCHILLASVQPGESAKIRINKGRVKVRIGGSNGGQDHQVIAKTIVSEELDIPQSYITLEHGDTDQLDQGVGTWGSRTTVIVSATLIEACTKLKEKAKEELGENYNPKDILNYQFDVTVFHKETDSVISFGANLARTVVDKETGIARVVECVAYYDAGRVINPSMAESQSIGGAAQAIGQVFYEEAKYNEQDGQIMTGTLEEAGVPYASLIPNIEIKLANHPSKQGEQIKGVGEGSATGMPPALVRSLELELGRRVTKTPMRPEEILAKTQRS